MKVLKYQQKAVQELVDKSIEFLSLTGQRHTLVFEAPTGAGKTIMASEMLMRLCTELAERADAPCSEVAFMWIAPNKLHEQSYFRAWCVGALAEACVSGRYPCWLSDMMSSCEMPSSSISSDGSCPRSFT